MRSKQQLREQIVIQSLVPVADELNSTRKHIEKLKILCEIVKNVLLVGKNYNLQIVIEELIKSNNLVEEESNLFIEPFSTSELADYLSSEMGISLLYSNDQSSSIEELQTQFDLLKELIQNKKLLQEIVPQFVEFLFRPKPLNDISDDTLLDLYIILSDEYRVLLEERDIENISMLGEKSVFMIINNVYSRIDSNKELSIIDKGLLTKYMRKFFFTIANTIDYLTPK